jgi:hypothetical protein
MSFETELKELFERHNVRIIRTISSDALDIVEFSYETQDGKIEYLHVEDNRYAKSLEYIGEK